MGLIDVIIRYKTQGLKKATKEVDALTESQEKQQAQQKKSNKETEKSVPRLNSVADALDQMGLTGAASLFSVGEGVNELSGGLRGIKGAIAAAGIGLFIVLVSQAAEAIKELIEFNSEAARTLRRLAAESYTLTNDIIQQQAQLQRFKLKNAETTRESLIEEFNMRADILTNQIKENDLSLKKAETTEEINRLSSEYLKLLEDADTLALQRSIALAELEKKNEDDRLAAIKERKRKMWELYNTQMDAAKKAHALEDLLAEQRADQLEAASREREASREEDQRKAIESAIAGLEEIQDFATEDLEAEDEILFDKRAAALVKWEQFKYEQKKKGVDAEKQLEEMRVGIASEGISAIANLSSAVTNDAKKAFNIQKAAQVAETIIGTYSAAQKAYNSQLTVPSPDAPIRAAVAAGVSIAQGLARVAAIRKTTFDGGGGGTPGGGGGSAPRTQFLVPTTQAPQTGQTEAAPVQAYVVGQEITNQQALDSELRHRSRL